ncbi:rCG50992 [Rattus norvegicus]|uniref:RCG50992 n=1 Tax=Rattus norvegicus TaxID=10116 RepID=A6KGF8_RAT|nr:rCG50992 [Rattus norvegicus]
MANTTRLLPDRRLVEISNSQPWRLSLHAICLAVGTAVSKTLD